jgi:maltose O-acetyltransferase
LIGSGSIIGDNTILDLAADIQIGVFVALGPKCIIYTHDHNYADKNISAPWKGEPTLKAVTIGDGAWIGSKVTILAEVEIGEKAIVVAGSVVTKSIPGNTLRAGITAKLLKTEIFQMPGVIIQRMCKNLCKAEI